MWAACIVRFFRRKIVLGIIFALSLTYCILSFTLETDEDYHENFIDTIPAKKIDGAFLWQSNSKSENDTGTIVTCRNSVQGKVLIVDDKGYVCSRSDILSNGCCDTSGNNVKQYSCETCKENGCCSIYEYCISCCLHPDKVQISCLLDKKYVCDMLQCEVISPFSKCVLDKDRTSDMAPFQHPKVQKILLQNLLGKASDTFRVLFASVTDHFELCLAKCRTSSLSVQHENSYRDPRAKHCYGENPPPSLDTQAL